jgi:hypothetical protein
MLSFSATSRRRSATRLRNALIATITCLAWPLAGQTFKEYVVPTGAIFELPSGERLAGHIVAVEQTGIVILKEDGSQTMIERDDDLTLRFRTVGGQEIVGRLRRWQTGIYELTTATVPVKVFSMAPRGLVPSAPLQSSPSGAVQQTALAVPPLLEIAASAMPAPEGGAPLVFNIDLSEPASRSLVLIYATIDGSAKGGIDFEPQRGVLIVDRGQISARLETPLINDGDSEDDEHLQLFLSLDPSIGTLRTKSITATIQDDD